MATLFVPRERRPGERRVAATPDTVKRFASIGVELLIEEAAGADAGYTDDAYQEAGAHILRPGDGWSRADVACAVRAPSRDDVLMLSEGAVLVGLLAPHRNLDVVAALAEGKVTALAMELIPRISRAQAMDALSSQANLAGYRAATLAAHHADKQFPLSMTAAGTLKPAIVVVLGAGVAGLVAIATARRLGAVVRANDIREAARGEVESLGAEFIDLEQEADAEAEGGYAKAVGEDFLAMQRQILGNHLAQADAVITTAFVPGKPAPRLVTREMVERMRPGSVLIDLAAEEGGNCELTRPDEEVVHEGVRILGSANLPSTLPGQASALYARNIFELTKVLVADGAVRVDRDDEVVAAATLTTGGQVVHEPTAQQLEGSR